MYGDICVYYLILMIFVFVDVCFFFSERKNSLDRTIGD